MRDPRMEEMSRNRLAVQREQGGRVLEQVRQGKRRARRESKQQRRLTQEGPRAPEDEGRHSGEEAERRVVVGQEVRGPEDPFWWTRPCI